MLVFAFCSTFHVADFAVFDSPTIIVECLELIVSYSWITFVSIKGIGCKQR